MSEETTVPVPVPDEPRPEPAANPSDERIHPEKMSAQDVYLRLNDGTDMTAHFQDGTSRVVRVKLVGLRHSAHLASSWMQEPKELLIYTGLTESEIEQFTEATWIAVLEEGRRINFQRLDAYLKRQLAWVEKMGLSQKAARLAGNR